MNPPPIPPLPSSAIAPPLHVQTAEYEKDDISITEAEVRRLSGPKLCVQYDHSLLKSWRSLIPQWFPLKTTMAAAAWGAFMNNEYVLIGAGAAATVGAIGVAKNFYDILRTRKQLKRHLQLREEVIKFNEAAANVKTHVKVTQLLNQSERGESNAVKALASIRATRESLVKALKLERILNENPSYRKKAGPLIAHESLNAISQATDDAEEWQSVFEATRSIEERLQRDFPTQGFGDADQLDATTPREREL